MARSRRPRGVATSGTARILAISAALRVASGKFAVGSGHEQVGGRVGLDPVLTAEPGEELGYRDQSLDLSAKRQGVTITLAVVEELLLVRKKAVEGDLGGINNPWDCVNTKKLSR